MSNKRTPRFHRLNQHINTNFAPNIALMRALKIFIIVTSSIMVAFLLWNLTLSSEYTVVETQQINVQPERVSSELTDLQNWSDWASYLQRDSTKTMVYSTLTSGDRAWVEWKLNDQSGGRLEIREVRENGMDFMVNFSNFSAVNCTLEWEGSENGTLVTWSASGELPFFARFAKGGFSDMISRDFRLTLNQLTAHLED